MNVNESPSGSLEPAALNVISSPERMLELGLRVNVEDGALLPLNCSKQPARGILIINKTNINASPRTRAIMLCVISVFHQTYGSP